MSIGVRITSEQLTHYQYALAKARIEFTHRGNIIDLDRSNYPNILQGLKDMHLKTVRTKTKTITHLERLFNLEALILNLENQSYHFLTEAEMMAAIKEANDTEETITEKAA